MKKMLKIAGLLAPIVWILCFALFVVEVVTKYRIKPDFLLVYYLVWLISSILCIALVLRGKKNRLGLLVLGILGILAQGTVSFILLVFDSPFATFQAANGQRAYLYSTSIHPSYTRCSSYSDANFLLIAPSEDIDYCAEQFTSAQQGSLSSQSPLPYLSPGQTEESNQEPLPSDSSAEAATTPPTTPPATVAQDDSAYLLPASFTDSSGQKIQTAISYQSTGYYAVIKKNGLWQPTNSLITGVGARGNPDPYAFATADEKVWFFDAGGSSANHLFFTPDGGATWSTFAPAGFEGGDFAPSFLQSVSLSQGVYTVELNYPYWSSASDQPLVFTSADGMTWTKATQQK